MAPRKVSLVILTFLALTLLPYLFKELVSYRIFDWASVGQVLVFRPQKSTAEPAAQESERTDVTQIPNSEPSIVERETKTEKETPALPHDVAIVDPSRSLNHFYESLAATEKQKAHAVTRIAHYGDSPTTADMITGHLRSRLQRQFGDAGHGFLLIAKPWEWYSHRGVDIRSKGWKIDVASQSISLHRPYGFGGARFAGSTGAFSEIRLSRITATEVEIAFLSTPESGHFTVRADDKEIGTVNTAGVDGEIGYGRFQVPAGTRAIRIDVTSGSVRLFGLQLRLPAPGVVYDSLGLNGAFISVLARRFDQRNWTESLRHYAPDLVIINYGTNESADPAFVGKNYEKQLKEVVQRVREALPHTSVLVMSPMDRGVREAGGEIGTVPSLMALVGIEERVAREMNCAFFNTFAAMGGEGTMGRWYESEPRLVGADFIHPMPAGANLVGDLLSSALMKGFKSWKLRQLKTQETVPSREGPA